MDGTTPGIETRKEVWWFFTQKAKWLPVINIGQTGSRSIIIKGADSIIAASPLSFLRSSVS
jgi:hypothetical protein